MKLQPEKQSKLVRDAVDSLAISLALSATQRLFYGSSPARFNRPLRPSRALREIFRGSIAAQPR